MKALVFDEPDCPGGATSKLLSRIDRPLDYDVLVVHCVPDLWPKIVADEIERERQRRGVPDWRPRRIVGVTIWETDRIHPRWVRGIADAQVTELWLPNRFNAEVFQSSGVKVPCFVVPHAHDIDRYDLQRPALDLVELGVLPSTFVFGAGFTWSPRKNPEGLITAYCAEFDPSEPVALVLKTYRGSGAASRQYVEEKIAETVRATGLARCPPIVVVHQTLPFPDLLALYRRMDVGVYPFRGEGWGLHVTESLLMETPCIVTNWSGPAELGAGTIRLGFQSAPVFGMPQHYDVRQTWAEPNLVQLRHLMRQAFSSPHRLLEIGAAGRRWVHAHCNLDVVGRTMRERL